MKLHYLRQPSPAPSQNTKQCHHEPTVKPTLKHTLVPEFRLAFCDPGLQDGNAEFPGSASTVGTDIFELPPLARPAHGLEFMPIVIECLGLPFSFTYVQVARLAYCCHLMVLPTQSPTNSPVR